MKRNIILIALAASSFVFISPFMIIAAKEDDQERKAQYLKDKHLSETVVIDNSTSYILGVKLIAKDEHRGNKNFQHEDLPPKSSVVIKARENTYFGDENSRIVFGLKVEAGGKLYLYSPSPSPSGDLVFNWQGGNKFSEKIVYGTVKGVFEFNLNVKFENGEIKMKLSE